MIQKPFAISSAIPICCYFGHTDLMINGQKVLIDACDEEIVLRYVAGDFAIDFIKIPAGAPFPKESTKIIIEYLKSKRVEGIHILVGVLMETFRSPYFQLYDAQSRILAHWGTGEDVWELTTFQTDAPHNAAIAVEPKAVGVFHCESRISSQGDYAQIRLTGIAWVIEKAQLRSRKHLKKFTAILSISAASDPSMSLPKTFRSLRRLTLTI
jgi:hypothetical protein